MNVALPSSLALALLLPVAQPSLPVADFNGAWVMVPERSESPQQDPPIRSLTLTVTQSAAELEVRAVRDGVASRTSFPIGSVTSAAPHTTRAYWQDRRLVAEQAGEVQGQTLSIRQIFALSADGSELTVETLVIVQHGYTLRGAQNYNSKSDVFTRAR